MERASIIEMMQSRMTTPADFDFDHLYGPPLLAVLSPQDIQDLHHIATSIKYSGNPQKKYKAIDNILKPRGFRKFGAGTNRIAYRYLNDDSFLLKVATDAVGINDNPKEFKNQLLLKPFVSKIFEVDPTGTVAVVERCQPITNREEFETVAPDVFAVITEFIIGKYIMADIGSQFFMNWSIRGRFGPVLHDFPYLYELDGEKLHCTEPDPNDPSKPCGGLIDYDDGFNKLYCKKCGKWYRVQELAKNPEFKNIINKRSKTMSEFEVVIDTGNGNIKPANSNRVGVPNETAKIEKTTSKIHKTATEIVVDVPKAKKVEAPVETKPEPKVEKNEPIVEITPASSPIIVDMPKEDTKQPEINRGVVRSNFSASRAPIKKPVVPDVNVSDMKVAVNMPETDIENPELNVPAPTKNLKSIHVKKVSYNKTFKTLTLNYLNPDNTSGRFVVELGSHPEIVQEIVDDSDYMKNVSDMKSATISTLKKNNEDQTSEIDTLTENLNQAKKRIHEIESKYMDLLDKYNKLQDSIDPRDAEIEDLKYKNDCLEKDIADLKEKLDYKPETVIPVPGKEEDVIWNDNDVLPGGIVWLDGTVTTLMAMGLTDKEEEDHKILIFDNGEGEYCDDNDGNLIVVGMINDTMVDKFDQLQLMTDFDEDGDESDDTTDADTDRPVSDN